jgi:hypothetical protein
MPPDGNESRKNHLCMRGSVPWRCARPGLGYLIDSRQHTMVIHGPGRRLIPTTALATGIGMKRRLTCLSFFPPMKHSKSGKIPFDPLKNRYFHAAIDPTRPQAKFPLLSWSRWALQIQRLEASPTFEERVFHMWRSTVSVSAAGTGMGTRKLLATR